MSAAADAFRLSRIHAQGWNAARLPGAVESDNPYAAEPERSRWQAGFAGTQTVVKKKLS